MRWSAETTFHELETEHETVTWLLQDVDTRRNRSIRWVDEEEGPVRKPATIHARGKRKIHTKEKERKQVARGASTSSME